MSSFHDVSHRALKLLSKIPLLLIVLAVFYLGYRFSLAVHGAGSSIAGPTAGATPVASEEVWTCSMHPQIRLPAPGQCPLCGMDLVQAEGGGAAATARPGKKPLYACSMFCLPPQPNPGNCQICGMDMVEVEVEDEAGDEGNPAPTITLSATARALADVRTAPVTRQFVTAELRMVGRVTYDETRLGHITAWVPGRLDRLYVDYTGIAVRPGDHLVYLYSPELATAQTELLQALERVTESPADEGSLVRQRARQWVDDIREKFRLWGLTDAQIAEIEARGTPADTMTIYAPMGGIVIHKNAVEGMYVNTGTRIYTIADLSRVWVKLDAYESDLQWLRYGQQVEFQTEAYPGDTFTGRIAFIDPVLNADTRTVSVRVNVENADGRLKPEMFVRAVVYSKVAAGGRVVDAELAGKWISPMHPEIVKDEPGPCDVCGMPLVRAESLGYVSVETGDATPPLVVPATSPLITGRRALVYLAAPDNPGRFEGREVVLGPRAGQFYIVKEGLGEGERVVVQGNFKIDSAMQIMARPSMMNPAGGGPAPTGHEHHGGTTGEHAAAPPGTLSAPRPEVAGQAPRFEVSTAFRTQLAPLYDGYAALQGALSRDALDEAVTAAGHLEAALKKVDMAPLSGDAHAAWMKEQAQLVAVAGRLAAARDIEDARREFALMSEGMIAVARRFGTAERALYRFHCPMAFDGRGADWLQTEDKTENPFFGATMFRCGTMEETIAVTATAGGTDDQP